MLNRRICALLALCALLYAWSAFAQAPTPPALRLPDAVQPKRYSVELAVVPSEERFRGSIDIELDVRKPTDIIWLNARYLKVDLAKLEAANQAMQARIVPGGEDFVGLQFDRARVPGRRVCTSSWPSHGRCSGTASGATVWPD